MFTVTGYVDGVAYRVHVGVSPGLAAGVPRAGCAVGDPGIAGLLADAAGEPWLATVTGPSGILNLDDPASVYGFLCDRTTITAAAGDVPDLTGPPAPSGSVY
jgi:hypothetical protein